MNQASEHQIDLSMYNIRTDLAREAHDMVTREQGRGSSIPGVRKQEETQDGITTSWIWIDSEDAGEQMGKLPGTYLTIEVPGLRSGDSMLEKRVSQHFAEQFSRFLDEVGIKPNDSCLVVGIGNWDVTPDSLGPLVVKHTLVTRHLFKLQPETVAEGYRSVSALSPGVLGTTGIETSEIVRGVVQKSKPDFVIAFDALASRALSRVNTTIQIADTGIQPGSGVGNNRKALTKEFLGVPVLAVGVPTVVDAVTIAHDTIDYVISHLGRELHGVKNNPLDPHNRPSVKDLENYQVPPETSNRMLGMFGSLNSDEKRQLIHEVLAPLGQNLIVTPKEVDSFIGNMAKLIANGLNCALHEAVTMKNVASHVQ
ncbi:GPR endopeptidase [Thermoactinomyces daqus]|uniref:Germination protease n=1 Tax=Thermoactinomyces daqus TaxID=1329516 RepID=A0A7W1X9M2_9BACL|nr:GPR endopeptidase [Thermoactinomyces daqus]MBA4542657.1 GPR endopeptidase [Thermoactinomyces daqus]